MNLRLLILSVAVAALVAFGTADTRAYYEFSAGISVSNVDDFNEPLGAYGTWVEVGSYGRCWHPAYVAAGWRPYCDGYWTWTDSGWFWVSDEPWGWACYHYGRWAWDPDYGWVWVPGVEWAPCWVEWRFGGGYVGWAPLPPACVFRPSGVIATEEFVIAPSAFVFVEERRFCDPIRPSTVIINNETIVNRTINVTNIKVVNNTVVVHGPAVATIQHDTGLKVRTADARALWQERTQRAASQASEKHVKAPPLSDTPRRTEAIHVAPSPSATPPRPVESQPSPVKESRSLQQERPQSIPSTQAVPEQSKGHWWWPFRRRPSEQPAPSGRPASEPSTGNRWPPGWGSRQPQRESPPETQPHQIVEPRPQNRGYFYGGLPSGQGREQGPPPVRQHVPPGQPAPHQVGPVEGERVIEPSHESQEEKHGPHSHGSGE